MKETLTLTQYIWQEQAKYPENRGVFSELLYEISLVGKIISREVNKAGIAEMYGLTGDINVQGEEVKKMDVFAQQTFENVLGRSGHLCAMASEEEEDIIPIKNSKELGNYVLVFDPIDGASNTDVNVSIGSIFAIYKRVSESGPGKMEDFLQSGRQQVAAGYLIYGSSTMFVYTTGNGVHGFTLDPELGEFLLTHENIKIPDSCQNFSTNESYYYQWPEGIRRYIDKIKKDGQPRARHIGSLIADIHRNLLEGGIHLYSSTKKHVHGKLRLMYENNPFAFLVEQAGGRASDGQQDILDIQPSELHQRTQLYIGNKKEVDQIEKLLQE